MIGNIQQSDNRVKAIYQELLGRPVDEAPPKAT